MDISTAQSHLDAWNAADLRLSKGKSASVNGREITLNDAREVRAQITYWQRVVDALNTSARGGNTRASLASFS